MTTCANCGFQGNGKRCSECGHAYIINRISISNLLHEVPHTFIHFDKGLFILWRNWPSGQERSKKNIYWASEAGTRNLFPYFLNQVIAR